jgi:DNA (cytosine-5)-methyltransferase 1
MRHGSLFSGLGGFDLAAEWMGWENIFHCEWMDFPRKVLDYYWPYADSHIDICKTDFKPYANRIDILTGGFPCQPFSLAGKRKGTDDERYLWGEMLRAIQEIKPKWVIAENVFGITNIDGGLVFEQVCLDLEAEAYEVQPFIIPAAAKNAPHRRDRVWFVAYNTGERLERSAGNQLQRNIKRFARNGNEWNATDTCCQGLERVKVKGGIRANRQEQNKQPAGCFCQTWKDFPTESPICSGDDRLPNQMDGITFPKWRAESIKGYGNAIVPQIAFEIFKTIKLENERFFY